MRIVVVLALILISLTPPARADEYGPHPAIRAIRGALPVLLARFLKDLRVSERAHVHDIVVEGDSAIATWSASSVSGVAAFEYHANGWWLTSDGLRTSEFWDYDLANEYTCKPSTAIGPTSESLFRDMRLPASLVRLAAAHVSDIAMADRALTLYRARNPADASLHYLKAVPYCYFSKEPALTSTLGGYRATITSAPHSSGSVLSEFTFRGRAPTESEMPPSRGADAVYFFSLQSSVAKKRFVETGSTLDVWAPFVLDPHLRYTLTLALGDPTIGPLAGTVSDNTMHFTLPAFSAPPSVELMGEIDADP